MANEYGIIVKDTSGNVVKLTPDIANVVSAGVLTMPSGLVDTNKYYGSIDLPGSDPISVSNIGYVESIYIHRFRLHATVAEHPTGRYMINFFADDAYTNYTKNLSTGVMTTWTPGDVSDLDDASKCDGVFCINSIGYWEKFGASSVTDVKIFAAMMYHVYDGGDSAFKDAYLIYTNGINEVTYAITQRRKVVE